MNWQDFEVAYYIPSVFFGNGNFPSYSFKN